MAMWPLCPKEGSSHTKFDPHFVRFAVIPGKPAHHWIGAANFAESRPGFIVRYAHAGNNVSSAYGEAGNVGREGERAQSSE
jgi:hypothetical protein